MTDFTQNIESLARTTKFARAAILQLQI